MKHESPPEYWSNLQNAITDLHAAFLQFQGTNINDGMRITGSTELNGRWFHTLESELDEHDGTRQTWYVSLFDGSDLAAKDWYADPDDDRAELIESLIACSMQVLEAYYSRYEANHKEQQQ